MLNIEKYKVEIEKQMKKDSVHSIACAVNTINDGECCAETPCMSCSIISLEWLAEEYKEKPKECLNCTYAHNIEGIENMIFCEYDCEVHNSVSCCKVHEGKDDE